MSDVFLVDNKRFVIPIERFGGTHPHLDGECALGGERRGILDLYRVTHILDRPAPERFNAPAETAVRTPDSALHHSGMTLARHVRDTVSGFVKTP